MKIYLINKEDNEIKNTYTNVDAWSVHFVEFTNNGLKTKIYCDIETEYFTDKIPEVKEVEDDESGKTASE